jgi:hypothetical protein
MRRRRIALVVVLFALTSMGVVTLAVPSQAHETCYIHSHQPYIVGNEIRGVAGIHCTAHHDRYRIEFCFEKNGALIFPCYVADTLTGWDAAIFHSQPRVISCSTGLWSVYITDARVYNNNGNYTGHTMGTGAGPPLLVQSGDCG